MSLWIPVNAQFGDGDTVNGELVAEVPAEKARLSDCLNLQNKFLSVKIVDKILRSFGLRPGAIRTRYIVAIEN